MSFKKTMAILLLMASLVACNSSSTPTATPAANESPTAADLSANGPTETSIPTSTIAPTATEAATALPTATLDGSATPTKAATATVAAPKATTAAGTTPVATTSGQQAGNSSIADKYAYVSQNLPDNYQVRPGRTITITWTVKNAGTTGWTTDYTVRHFGGVEAKKESYNLTKNVPAEGMIPITITIVAPSALGTYSTWWKLTNPAGQNFGDIDFTFTVTNNPVQPTAAPAATAVPATKAAVATKAP